MSLSDIHKLKENAQRTKEYFEFLELMEIPKCIFYSYDNRAFEEYCNCEEMEKKRGVIPNTIPVSIPKDFDSKEECWQCKFRKVR